MRTRSEQDAAHHAVATHTTMMRSRRSPDVTAAAILLESPACAMHPLALQITLVLRQVLTCVQTAQLMSEGVIRHGRAINLVFMMLLFRPRRTHVTMVSSREADTADVSAYLVILLIGHPVRKLCPCVVQGFYDGIWKNMG